MDRVTAVDNAIDRLSAVYEAAGVPQLRPPDPESKQSIAQVAEAIAPLSLPAEVERFWQRVDPNSITVGVPGPDFDTPASGLEAWVMHAESPGMVPKILFNIGYESHGHTFMELDDGNGSASHIFDWHYGGMNFELHYAQLADYLTLVADLTEARLDPHFFPNDEPIDLWDDRDAFAAKRRLELLATHEPLPGYLSQHSVGERVSDWPSHWLAADNLTPEARMARGATHSIAELIKVAAAGELATGTIRAGVTGLAGSGEGSQAKVSDGTGELTVWCPAAVCVYGPSMRSSFEFDVEVHPLQEQRSESNQQNGEPQTTTSEVIAIAATLEDRFSAKYFAEAQAVRPLA